MKRVLGNLFWTTASKLLDAAVRFLTVPIVLAHFGKLEFGLLALAFSINVFLAIADFGLNINAVRRLSDHLVAGEGALLNRLVRACSFYYTVIGAINLVAVLVLGWMGPTWLKLDAAQAGDFFWMMSALGVASFVSWSFAVHRQLIQAAGQLGWDERNNLICTLCVALLVWLTVVAGLDVVTYYVATLVIGLLPVALRVGKVRRLAPEVRIGLQRDWHTFKPMVNASAMIFIMSVAQVMAIHFRPLILAARGSLEDVADYRILQGVVSFALLVSGGLLNVIYPEVARLEAQGDTRRLRELAHRGTGLLLWGHLLLVAPLMLASGQILQLYVGDAFTYLALPLALWLLTCIAGHNAIFSSVLLSRGRLGWLTSTSVFNAVLTLALAWWLVPAYGLDAVVWTYVLYFVLQTIVFYGLLAPPLQLGTLAQIARIAVRPVLGVGLAVALSVAAVVQFGGPLWVAGLLSALTIVCAWALVGGGWRGVRALFPGAARGALSP